jgi:hypothetical protein
VAFITITRPQHHQLLGRYIDHAQQLETMVWKYLAVCEHSKPLPTLHLFVVEVHHVSCSRALPIWNFRRHLQIFLHLLKSLTA